MYDLEKITKIIKDIEGYRKELDSYEIKEKQDLEDSKTIHAASMVCFSILNRLLDLGQEVLIKENQGMPDRYAEVFDDLAKAGIMNKEEAKEINKLINFRNILAHAYFNLEEKDIFKIVKNINLIDTFIEKIKKRVKK